MNDTLFEVVIPGRTVLAAMAPEMGKKGDHRLVSHVSSPFTSVYDHVPVQQIFDGKAPDGIFIEPGTTRLTN